jgi:hypothetical protein
MIMRKCLLVASVLTIGLVMLSSFSLAQHHGGAATPQKSQSQPAMKMASTDVFADGMQITVMVMRNETHKGMLQKMNMTEELEPGTTHNIMVLIRDEKTGKELTGGKVTLKVVNPDEKEQVKPGNYKEMMRTYDAYFKLADKGRHQVLVLFESGGNKRTAGVSYDAEGCACP